MGLITKILLQISHIVEQKPSLKGYAPFVFASTLQDDIASFLIDLRTLDAHLQTVFAPLRSLRESKMIRWSLPHQLFNLSFRIQYFRKLTPPTASRKTPSKQFGMFWRR